jgi:hypothetical protein
VKLSKAFGKLNISVRIHNCMIIKLRISSVTLDSSAYCSICAGSAYSGQKRNKGTKAIGSSAPGPNEL